MTDSAPPYEELDTHANYAAVPQNDTLPDEEQPPHRHTYLNHTAGCSNGPLAPAATFQPHVHCKECDRFTHRRQKLHAERFCCAMVAATFMVAFFCTMILGVPIVKAKRGQYSSD
ncbi:hypothetical protein BJX96DRAFT_180896 [Aspergillus floccosus]